MPSLFSFRGRADRTEWWVTSILTSLVGQLAAVFGIIELGDGDPLRMVGGAIMLLISLAAVEIHIAVSVKRMRDRGRSPWWLLTAFIPFLGWLWLWLELAILPGQDHAGPKRLVRKQVVAETNDQARN